MVTKLQPLFLQSLPYKRPIFSCTIYYLVGSISYHFFFDFLVPLRLPRQCVQGVGFILLGLRRIFFVEIDSVQEGGPKNYNVAIRLITIQNIIYRALDER